MTAPGAKKGEKKMSSSTVEDLTEKLSGISVTPEPKRSPSIPTHPSSGSGLIIKKAQHGLHQPPPPPPLETDKNSISKLEENEGSSSGGSLPGEQREAMRLSLVQSKKDFRYMERVNGRMLNILEGLELHTGVFSAAEQKGIVDCVYDLQDKGRRGRLRECTYSEPRKWMRGKGRVTIQFGCCYNYARDKNGNPPGIIRDEEADPIPPFLKNMIKKMVAWEVLPPSCIPNSCIINIYDKDDCIPPHIDHHDFVRPFCTVSFLTECNIAFGTELKVLGPGEFLGSTEIPLPVGSVLVLKGNGADVAKHCVPAVPAKRISVTFRKMDESKLPYGYTPDPELQNLQPRQIKPTGSPSLQVRTNASRIQPQTGHGTLPTVWETQPHHRSPSMGVQKGRSEAGETSGSSFQFDADDFPPLGSSSASSRRLSRPLRQ